MTEKPPLPKLPGGPDPSQPVPRTPVAGVDLAGYARVAAALAEAAEPRAAVLARAGLDEARWLDVEKTWLLRIATAGLAGDLALVQEHDAAAAAARADLAASAPPVPLEVYAQVTASMEGGAAPARALAEAKLSPAAYARASQAWTAAMAGDAGLTARFRDLVEQARRRGG
jgi:hypothetical protein